MPADLNPLKPEDSSLGKVTPYVSEYQPALLCPLPRATKRRELGLAKEGVALPFMGADLWTAYEISWLNLRGKPQVAIGSFTVPCETPNLIESKSLKLYLNSFNGTRLADIGELQQRLRADLTEAVWRGGGVPQASVGVRLLEPAQFDQEPIHELHGLSLDRLDIECTRYQPAPELLTAAFDEQPVTETLVSQLLKSNCLVTGQPDWGAIQIAYSGPQIAQEGLLQYLVSFRDHNEFHEQCVERIFTDIWHRCRPASLSVYARYTRRGGLDINPFRSSHPARLPPNIRIARQ